MLPSSGARRSLASVGCTYRTRVVSSPYLRKLAHRQVIEALSTRSSSAALLGYLAADYLPTGADPFARAVAGAALLSAGAARLASRKPPSSALLTGLIAHPWKCTHSPWPLQQKA